MFTKQKSTIVKAVAILMMMWHHCFLAGRFEMYDINFFPFNASQIANIANFFKICVSLFAFVSGYGLMKSYSQKQISTNYWIRYRILRTLSGYWFIVVISWIVSMIIDQRPYYTYNFPKSIFCGICNLILDFMGLSNLFGTDLLNGTWWYMSAAAIFIILLPLIDLSIKYFGNFCTIGLVFILPRVAGGYPGGTTFLSFLPAFCLGMIFSQKDLFTKWKIFWQLDGKTTFCNSLFKFLVMLSLLYCSYKIYYYLPTDKFWDVKWGLIPIVIILFVNDYISNVPVLRDLLLFIGKHSTNIFLVHTFIRHYYLAEFTYSIGHFAIIILVLLVISILISLIIEYLKKIIGYEMWIDKLIKWVMQ